MNTQNPTTPALHSPHTKHRRTVAIVLALTLGLTVASDFPSQLLSLSISIESADAQPRSRARAKPQAKPSRKQKKIDRHLFTARYFYLTERNLPAAAREFRKVIALDKDHVGAALGLASVHREEKQPAKAVRALKKLIARNTGKAADVRVFHELARAQKDAGKAAASFSTYKKTAASFPADRESRWQILSALAQEHKSDGGRVDAVAEAAIAFLRLETNRNAFRYRSAERMLVEVREEPVGLIVYDANQAYRDAFTERRIGKINAKMDEARRGYLKCLEMQAKNQRCHYGLGMVYASVKASSAYDTKKAVAHFRKASKLAEANFEIGRLARTGDDFETARDALARALTLRKDYPQALLELGIIEKLDGNTGKAKSFFVRAHDLDAASGTAAKAVDELAKIDPNHDLVRRRMQGGHRGGDVFSTERFKAAVALVEKAFGGVETEAGEKKMLERIVSRIAAAADMDTSMPIRISVLKTKVVNALALPSGDLYVTRGLLDHIGKTWTDRPVNANNDVLAHVIAHEVAHIVRQHTLKSALFRQAVKDSGARINHSVLTHVTRLQEIEADRVGIVLASLAGYHPRGGIDFMEQRGGVAEIPTHLDHPTYEERARYLEDYWTNDVKYAYLSFELGNQSLAAGDRAKVSDLAKARTHYTEAIDHLRRFRNTLRPTKRVLNNLGVAYAKRGLLTMDGRSSPLVNWQSRFSVEKESALKYRSIARPVRPTRGSSRRNAPADIERAVKLFGEAIGRDPAYRRAKINLGMAQLAIGRLAAARKTLAAIKGGSAELSLSCGIVLAEMGEYGKATKAFSQARRHPVTKRQATFNLARTHLLAKQPAKAKKLFDSYLKTDPTGPWAEAAKRALSQM